MDINLTTKSGETVNALSAYLSYPRDSMKIEWITYQNSFNITTEESFQDGNIKITRGNINPQSGVLKVGTIGFTPTKAGPIRLSFLSGSAAPSAIDSKDTLDLTNSKGATYQVAVKQPGPTDAPALTDKKILPKIDQISVSAIATNSAVVAWQTDIAADSFAQYGVEKGKYTFTEYASKFVTDHKLKISGSHLKAGTQYYLRIKSKDSSGNLSASEEMAIQLLGEPDKESIFQKAPDVQKLGPLTKNLSYAIGASLVMILLAILIGFLIRRKKPGKDDTDPYLGSD